MNPTQVAFELIEMNKQGKETATGAIGRYKNYVLIDRKFGINHVEPNYVQVKEICQSLGYKLIRWSSLSQDEDDENEFGIKNLSQ